MVAWLAGAAGVLGLLVGSFLNLVAQRVPQHQAVLRPGPCCPSCSARVALVDRVPVVSWLVMSRRCRSCEQPISARYPLVELGTAGLFAAGALRLGAAPALPAYLVFFAALVTVAAVDLEYRIVPNRVVYPALGSGAVLLVAATLFQGSLNRLGYAALGGIASFAAILVLNLISPRLMGMGDVRLAGLIGLFLGWLGLAQVLVGLFVGFLLGAAAGLVLAARGPNRNPSVPFAPFLAAGAVLTVLWGNTLVHLLLGQPS